MRLKTLFRKAGNVIAGGSPDHIWDMGFIAEALRRHAKSLGDYDDESCKIVAAHFNGIADDIDPNPFFKEFQ